VAGGGQVGNAPAEGLPPGCSCVLVAPGTLYEALVLTPTCLVHGVERDRGRKVRVLRRARNGF